MSETIVIAGVSVKVDIKFANDYGVRLAKRGFMIYGGNGSECSPQQYYSYESIRYINYYGKKMWLSFSNDKKPQLIYIRGITTHDKAFGIIKQSWANYVLSQYDEKTQLKEVISQLQEVKQRLDIIEDILRYAPPPLPAGKQFAEASERFETNIKEL